MPAPGGGTPPVPIGGGPVPPPLPPVGGGPAVGVGAHAIAIGGWRRNACTRRWNTTCTNRRRSCTPTTSSSRRWPSCRCWGTCYCDWWVAEECLHQEVEHHLYQ